MEFVEIDALVVVVECHRVAVGFHDDFGTGYHFTFDFFDVLIGRFLACVGEHGDAECHSHPK